MKNLKEKVKQLRSELLEKKKYLFDAFLSELRRATSSEFLSSMDWECSMHSNQIILWAYINPPYSQIFLGISNSYGFTTGKVYFEGVEIRFYLHLDERSQRVSVRIPISHSNKLPNILSKKALENLKNQIQESIEYEEEQILLSKEKIASYKEIESVL